MPPRTRPITTGDYKAALAELQPLAKAGDAKAQRLLGKMYADGLGLDQDYKQAALWYQRSANQGFAAAMADLGDLYFYGNGVRQDQREALRWYRQGADHGDPEAEYDYGLIFHDGSGGQKRSFDAAMKWFLRAAAQGHAAALNMVGYMHDMGEGVKEDPSEAVKWYQKAADKGFEVAEYNLGVMYQSGRGVEKNLATAARWYRAAAEQGDSDSQASLGYLYEQGLGVDSDVAQAISWYKAAARQGSSRALNNLGVLYHDGTGVPRNLVYAYVLYALAADKAEESDDRKLADSNRNDVAKELSSTRAGRRPRRCASGAASNLALVLPPGPRGECRRPAPIARNRPRTARAPGTSSKNPDKSAVGADPAERTRLPHRHRQDRAGRARLRSGKPGQYAERQDRHRHQGLPEGPEPAAVRRDLLRSPGRLAGLALRGEQCQQDRDHHAELAQAEALCHRLGLLCLRRGAYRHQSACGRRLHRDAPAERRRGAGPGRGQGERSGPAQGPQARRRRSPIFATAAACAPGI